MTELSISLWTNAKALLARVEALAAYVERAPEGDPLAEMAAEIGEIDMDRDVEFETRWEEGHIVCDVVAIGELARMLHVFDELAQ